jgi:PAS domain S-box-containing protein
MHTTPGRIGKRDPAALNRTLQAIFEASSDGIWVCDGDGIILDVNRTAEKLNGIRAREVIGKPISYLEEKGLTYATVTPEVIRTGRRVSVMPYVKRTGKHLLCTGTPVFDDHGRLFLVVVNERDITELNAIREELQQSRMVTAKMSEELAELTLLETETGDVVAESEEMQQVLKTALKLSRLDASSVLILGETGTGKGMLAKFIHRHGRRAGKPFVQLNSAALPETLLEAELFGYERGAFTGAREDGKAGLIEMARGGTLFLDEIGDLPLAVQAKLLRYLDDREVIRLGGTRPRKIDCTILSATHRDLSEQVVGGDFRSDLFYRLNAFTVVIPPLRERPEDIFQLARHYMQKFNSQYRVGKRIGYDGLEAMRTHPFPGNVRELKNIIRNAVAMSEDNLLDSVIRATLPGRPHGRREAQKANAAGLIGKTLPQALQDIEKELLQNALQHCRSLKEMSNTLGVSIATVFRRMKKYDLSF